MDGNKKIRGIVLAGIAVFVLHACKVQAPGYVSLYVDNLISVNDTAAYPGEAPLNMVDTTAVIEAEPNGDMRPAKEIIIVSSDSVYQHEVKSLLKGVTDSVQLLRRQVIELQKQLTAMPATGLAGEKPQELLQADSLHTEVEFKQLLQEKNDTITMLRNQVSELKKSTDLKADTVYVTKEILTQFEGDSIQTDYEITRLLQSKNDTILSLRNQLNNLKSSGIIKADTVYLIRETAGSPVAENQQNDQHILQLLRIKDEQINRLQNQLNSLQNATPRIPQPTQINRELAQVQPLASQQPDQSTLQLFQAQNDTIQFLRTQLRDLQLQPHKRDTVYIEKEAKELQPVKEIDAQRESDLQSLQDTIRLLKTRVLSLEKQVLPGIDKTATAWQDEKDEPLTTITDTTLLIAYYQMGEIKPLEEEVVLQQIKEMCKAKNVTKITLSGYTDSSGSEIINKEITNRRLNYLAEMIMPWITKEKIFFQNFGDVFASDLVVKDERRIEIRIHTK